MILSILTVACAALVSFYVHKKDWPRATFVALLMLAPVSA